MRVASAYIGNITDATYLRVIGVQLKSPFTTRELIIQSLTGRPTWDAASAAAEQRVARVHSILGRLLHLEALPDAIRIVAFPEYTVPEIAHADGYFQKCSDSSNCILIPGTHFRGGQTSSAVGQNICHIYIPHHPPITLEKRYPTPTEETYVAPPGSLPNIARLHWQRSNKQTVSVNIFICRDYLRGLREYVGNTLSEEAAVATATESDFVDEGLNIVLMHTDETRLFEGIGGVDLRGLRGQRRLALLVNAANVGAPLGSAFIGATSVPERDDIVRSLPPDKEGVLTADVRLWNIRESKTRLGEVVNAPIKKASVYTIDQENIIDPAALETASHRAIWRPAMLEALNISIAMEFFIATRITTAIHLFESMIIPRLYVSTVRGTHDIVVRRYSHDSEVEGGTVDSFLDALPRALQGQFREALQCTTGSRMTLHFGPRDILKYRGQPTVHSPEDYRSTLQYARQLLGANNGNAEKSQSLLFQVLDLADGCTPDTQVPEELKPLLYEKPEAQIAIGAGTEVRETYIFISLHNPSNTTGSNGQFAKEFVDARLMESRHVREIFKFSKYTEQKWDYLLKLKCTSRAADALVQSMREWADEHDLNVATRTVDLTSYITRSSLKEVVSSTFNQDVRAFIEQIKQDQTTENFQQIADLAISRASHGKPLLVGLAKAWARSPSSADGQTAIRETQEFQFYSNLLLHFCYSEETRYLEGAINAVRTAAFKMDQIFESALAALFESGALGACAPDASRETALTEQIRQFAFPKVADEVWDRTKTDVGAKFFGVARGVAQKRVEQMGLADDEALLEALKVEQRQLTNDVKPIRNLCSHGDNWHKINVQFDLLKDGWQTRLDRLEKQFASIATLTLRGIQIARLAKG